MITHPDVVATLNPEDLRAWQAWMARDDAINLKPSDYNRDEIEAHFRQRIVLIAEFITRYDLIDTPYLSISGSRGSCYYEKDSD